MSTDLPFILDALQNSSTVEAQVRFPCSEICALTYFFSCSMCDGGCSVFFDADYL